MIINRFNAELFRNLKDVEMLPCDGVNMICGENGQGKTNLIEGIWLFTGFKSFRTKKNQDFIPHDNNFYKISVDFFGENRDQFFEIEGDENSQTVFKNKVKVTSTRSIIGDFFSVVFSPTHLNLIKGGPDEKRRFLDISISQLKPSYARNLNDYYKALKQRNALLKNIGDNLYDEDFLEVWDENLARIGSKVICERQNYIDKIKDAAQNFYCGISDGRERLELQYIQPGRDKSDNPEQVEQILLKALKKSRESDIRRGITSKGPHRDDLEIILDGKSIKSFGSQGQQRSAALSLKLGEAFIINDYGNEKPVALLDDVMSELDVKRQNYILNELSDWQVFITCCEPSQVLRMKSGKAFNVENGKIV